MNWGTIYNLTWFGNTNQNNSIGWGIIHAILTGVNYLLASMTNVFSDTTLFTADKTVI